MSTRDRAHQIRELSLELALAAGTCHIGSALSIADALAVLFFDVMDHDSDVFLLSKAHAGSALMATLALRGTVDRDTLLREYCQDGGAFGGHAERGVAGVELSGGSLGHGLSIAAGRALAARLDRATQRTFVLLGDGECDEGSVWEAAALAGRLGLANLVAIVDANGFQGLERDLDADHWERFAARWRSAGWDVAPIDGHDHDALRTALSAPASDAPRCVVARTVKARGLPLLEGTFVSHYKSFRPHERDLVLDSFRSAS